MTESLMMTALPLDDAVPLDDVLTSIVNTAKRLLTTEGVAEPVAHIVGKNMKQECASQRCVYGMSLAKFMGDEDGKDLIAKMMPKLCSTLDAVAVIMVSEAWTVRGDPESVESIMSWRDQHGTLEGHPDCVDALTIHMETLSGSLAHCYPILRDDKGDVTGLGEDMWEDRDAAAVGRMANWLRPKEMH